MDPCKQCGLLLTRRHFFSVNAAGLGAAVLASLLGEDMLAEGTPKAALDDRPFPGLPGIPQFPPKAKRVIWLFQSGGPSQMDLFDYKPELKRLEKTELPESIRMGQRLTGMTAAQTSFPVAPSIYEFKQHGQSGAWVSSLMPRVAE